MEFVQEFVKNKGEYLPMLVEAIDDFTTDWEKENDMVSSSGDSNLMVSHHCM